jgi:propanol-preferring alcohol dehydrogenase
MAETMKAAVVHEYGKPLVIEEVPVPEVRPGRILVKVEACSRPTRSTTSTGSLSG